MSSKRCSSARTRSLLRKQLISSAKYRTKEIPVIKNHSIEFWHSLTKPPCQRSKCPTLHDKLVKLITERPAAICVHDQEKSTLRNVYVSKSSLLSKFAGLNLKRHVLTENVTKISSVSTELPSLKRRKKQSSHNRRRGDRCSCRLG